MGPFGWQAHPEAYILMMPTHVVAMSDSSTLGNAVTHTLVNSIVGLSLNKFGPLGEALEVRKVVYVS